MVESGDDTIITDLKREIELFNEKLVKIPSVCGKGNPDDELLRTELGRLATRILEAVLTPDDFASIETGSISERNPESSAPEPLLDIRLPDREHTTKTSGKA